MKAKVNKKKQVKEKVWKSPAQLGDYDAVAAQAVHLTAKAVNTNAEAAGVRLDAKQFHEIPYVCVTSIGPATVPLDYASNASKAGVMLQLDAMTSGQPVAGFTGSPTKEELERATNLKPSLRAHVEVGTDFVDERLRQILFPVEVDEYIALTPLPSTGLAHLVKTRVQEMNEVLKQRYEQAVKNAKTERIAATRKPRHTHEITKLGYGGANPQNMGRYVRSMCNVLVFNAPTENQDLRRVYSIFYNGLQLQRTLRPEIYKYAHWIAGRSYVQRSDLASREQEKQFVRAIALRAIDLANDAARIMKDNGFGLTIGTHVPFVEQLMINREQRDRTFKIELASYLAQIIRDFEYVPKGGTDPVQIGITNDDMPTLRTIIEEMRL